MRSLRLIILMACFVLSSESMAQKPIGEWKAVVLLDSITLKVVTWADSSNAFAVGVNGRAKGSPVRLYRSNDGGISWNTVPFIVDGIRKELQGTGISQLVAASIGGLYLSNVGSNSLLFSSDLGQSWHKRDTDYASGVPYCFWSSRSGFAYCSQRAIGTTRNSGYTFQPESPSRDTTFDNNYTYHYELTPAWKDSTHWLVPAIEDSGIVLLSTEDAGATWVLHRSYPNGYAPLLLESQPYSLHGSDEVWLVPGLASFS